MLKKNVLETFVVYPSLCQEKFQCDKSREAIRYNRSSRCNGLCLLSSCLLRWSSFIHSTRFESRLIEFQRFFFLFFHTLEKAKQTITIKSTKRIFLLRNEHLTANKNPWNIAHKEYTLLPFDWPISSCLWNQEHEIQLRVAYELMPSLQSTANNRENNIPVWFVPIFSSQWTERLRNGENKIGQEFLVWNRSISIVC